ncbi:hypothetical protein [Streptomyces sp. NPDC090025]|uniref:hypothetical protein n=1 Tax=Streptomyces sp. NPDC090025 TaxID=3365922 RepID=UPI00383383B4
MALMRAQHWDLGSNPPTPLNDPTSHADCMRDIEGYLIPLEQAREASLYTWGVTDGLRVTAQRGQSGLAIATGAALDSLGRLVALGKGSFAIVDPNADPTSIHNIATVPVGQDGVTLASTGPAGNRLLTITWREVLGADDASILLHTPWLRLLAESAVPDTGTQVVLARVTVDDSGAVTGLAPGSRRTVGAHVQRLELRRPTATDTSAGLRVDQVVAVELAATATGDFEMTQAVPGGGAARTALKIAADSGNAGLGTASPSAGLHVERGATNDLALRLSSSGAGWGSGLQLENRGGLRTYGLYTGADGRLHLADVDAGTDRITVGQDGYVGIGIAQVARRVLHVEGPNEVHSGGPGGGFSFADRNVRDVVDDPRAGERWVWYAHDGHAALWSGIDRVSVGIGREGDTLDVSGRMRVRKGADDTAGIWFHQNEAGHRAFVGMLDNDRVGLYGVGIGWGLSMNVNEGGLNVNAQHVGIVSRGNTGIIASGGFLAGRFEGIVSVTGDLYVDGHISKGGGGFTIDHPLDPAGKYLSHSFVESPEMLNLYAGTVVTDDSGEATVTLPDYFDALNRDFRYQLTPVGDLAAVAVVREIADNTFAVRSDRPGVTVCWQVTGVRKDAWAEAHRITVEEDKSGDEYDSYLHPAVHGMSADRAVARFAVRTDQEEAS